MGRFHDMLEAQYAAGKFVCVGLDSEFEKLPATVREDNDSCWAITEFNRAIIDATRDIALAYKPNAAFYEAMDTEGWSALDETVEYAKQVAPHIPVILDAKRADIGNTNKGYVKMAFENLGVDAITVHPYLGHEALKPFLANGDKGVIVLCKTSNPGAGEFQDLIVNVRPEDFDEIYQGQPADAEHFSMPQQMPLWRFVAHRVHGVWNRHSRNCGLVVGATYPDDLAVVRSIVGEMPILIPGIGTQGGDLEKTVAAGKDRRGRGMIINSSSAIIFASKERDYAEAARNAALKLDAEIRNILYKEKADVRVSD